MGVTLSSAAVACANKVDGDGAYLALLEIIIPGEAEHIYLVRNNEDIYWRNQLWQAFPFTLSDRKDDNKGTLSNITIDVDNSTRDLEYYLNQGGGGAGSKVILRCVRSDDLTATEADFEEYFSVKSTTVTESKVSFSLGNAYSTKSRRPWRRYLKNTCPFKYKSVRCGCTSSLATCNHTLADCRERGNSKRFGAFPGIQQGGVYV